MGWGHPPFSSPVSVVVVLSDLNVPNAEEPAVFISFCSVPIVFRDEWSPTPTNATATNATVNTTMLHRLGIEIHFEVFTRIADARSLTLADARLRSLALACARWRSLALAYAR